MAKGGIGGGVINYVFGSILILAVLGFVVNIVINALPTGSDNLGVMSGITTYGPTVITIVFVMLIVVVVAYMLRYLGVMGGG